MHPSRISLSFIFLSALLAGTQVAQAAATCPANNTLSTPTADFTVNGNGTVTHLKTGLMWKQCAEGLSTTTTACDTGSASTMNWATALTTAAADSTAGFNDWRLPNDKELESIVETGCYTPSINETAFPNTPSNWFWSSTAYASVPADAWFVSFANGGSNAVNKPDLYDVRLVRSGQSFDSFDAQKANQSISFGVAPTVTAGGTGAVNATATSTLPVTFTSTTPSICTVSGSTVTGVSAGSCIIAADQAGNGSYNAAPQVTQSFNVTNAAPTSIPTLSEWGMFILSALLSIGAIFTLRRSRL